MAAIAVGERKNGGALIVVRIVLPSGFDPADYSVFQALFGMIFPPRVRGAVNGSRRGVKRPRWEVESHRGPLPNDSTLGGQVGWRLITGRALPSCGGAEFQVQAGLHDIDVGSDIDWKRRHRPDWTECAAAEAHAVIIAETVVVVFNEAG
jgi:hypothetical protein